MNMKLTMVLLLAAGLHAAELKLGKPLTLQTPTPIPTLLATPDPHIGKLVQVKGKVTEVCQNMGCWMAIVDPASGKSVRIKVNDGDIVFPKDAPGKTATAEGIFKRIQLTKEQAVAHLKHEAEEKGKSFDPSTVKSAMMIYQLAGEGAVIVD